MGALLPKFSNGKTTIVISKETRRNLKAAKRGGETYDELLDRLFRLQESADRRDVA